MGQSAKNETGSGVGGGGRIDDEGKKEEEISKMKYGPGLGFLSSFGRSSADHE